MKVFDEKTEIYTSLITIILLVEGNYQTNISPPQTLNYNS